MAAREKPVTLAPPRLPTCDHRWVDWTPLAVAEATDGTVKWEDRHDRDRPGERLESVVIDSRLVRGGELFVAIKAERDGHQFVPAAVDAGASAVMVDQDKMFESVGVPAVVVEDTGAALLALGTAARARLAGQVVGITGSVGKTSTKDLAAAALAAARTITASEGSFNNELGVPLTLANAAPGTEVTIVEMGARGPGHIALLSRVAKPTIAVVTAVAAAHTEAFGTLDNVAAAKGELVQSLPSDGTAVLNADDERVAGMAALTQAGKLFYSVSNDAADLLAADVRLDDELIPRFVARTPWGTADVVVGARGAQQVPNALAALAVACLCGVPLEKAVSGLASARLSRWRMELTRTATGGLLLNDAYNANPASMKVALESLAALPASRRIAVLGEMAELGDRSPEDHMAVAALADRLSIEVLPVGTDLYGRRPAAGIDEAERLLGDLGPGVAVLVKASRVAGLERLASRLVGNSTEKEREKEGEKDRASGAAGASQRR